MKILMTKRRVMGTIVFAFGIALLGTASPLRGESFQWGRDTEGGRTFSLELMGGGITKLEGTVEETSRPYYEMIGKEAQGESYTLSDLGLDKRIYAWGGRLEKRWKYVTFAFSASYLKASASTVADQNYYIGIADKIDYEGKEYEYMMIPEGESFTSELPAGMVDLQFLVTPLTWQPVEGVKLVPWLCLDLFGIFGRYDLDAGPPTGTVIYEDPPREYVVGGHSQGWIGMGIPGVGPGGEIVIGRPEGIRLVLQANCAFFKYNGSTDNFPVKVRHEKNLDLNYYNLMLKSQLEVPLSSRVDLVAGVTYQYIKADASIDAQAHSPEEIEELREKWDKDVDFELSMVTGNIGIRF